MKRISDQDIARAVKAYNEGCTLKETGELIGASVSVVKRLLLGAGVMIRGSGFAGIRPERRREIAAKGGASLEPHQRSFSQDRSLAKAAGRKGGLSSHHTFAQAAE